VPHHLRCSAENKSGPLNSIEPAASQQHVNRLIALKGFFGKRRNDRTQRDFGSLSLLSMPFQGFGRVCGKRVADRIFAL